MLAQIHDNTRSRPGNTGRCGRYRLVVKGLVYFHDDLDEVAITTKELPFPAFNASPGQSAPVVRPVDDEPAVANLR